MRPDTALVSFTANGIIVCLFGTFGLVWQLRYFSVVFSMNCCLFMPFVSQMISVMLQVDQWPGWMTWVGVFIVSFAVNMIYQGELKRHQITGKVAGQDEIELSQDNVEKNDQK